MRRALICIAAFYGLSGVALSAASAHLNVAASVETATLMQFIHALASLAAIALLRGRGAIITALVFQMGTLLFAGALYSGAFLRLSLGPVAPVGGLLLMLGWALFGGFALRTGAAEPPR